MTDLEALSQRLFIAIAIAPVTFAACDEAAPERPSSPRSDSNARAEAPPPEPDVKPPYVDPPPEEWGKASEPPPEPDPPPPQPVVLDPQKVCNARAGKVLVTIAEAESRKAKGATTLHGCPARLDPTHGREQHLAELATQRIRDSGDTDRCCYEGPYPTRGRPFFEGDAIRRPRARVGAPLGEGESSRSCAAIDDAALRRIDPSLRRRIAAGWLADAREESAAVAAFERAAIELLDVGGPASLVRAYIEAAADERRHTQACLAIARRYAGRAMELFDHPEPIPRPPDLLRVLCDAFAGGCVGETAAALVASRASRRAIAPIASVLQTIAADEAQHAELAWRTLAWGLPRASADERARFFAFVATRAPDRRARRSVAGEAAAHGRMPRSEQAAIAREVWRAIVVPLLATLRDGDRGRAMLPGGVETRRTDPPRASAG